MGTSMGSCFPKVPLVPAGLSVGGSEELRQADQLLVCFWSGNFSKKT